MHILITAGGTSEPIDAVRHITNSSTGALAAEIHDTFVEHLQDHRDYTIHYVAANVSVMPKQTSYTNLYRVYDTVSVESVINKILTENSIDIMIHCMAISDYYVAHVHNQSSFIHDLAKALSETSNNLDEPTILAAINATLKGGLDRTKKIRSSEDLILHLAQTPKIIAGVRNLSPDTRLVGFKLLENVTEDELIQVASKQQEDNGCAFVVANDKQHVSRTAHKALIISQGKVLERCSTKKGIAEAILKELSL